MWTSLKWCRWTSIGSRNGQELNEADGAKAEKRHQNHCSLSETVTETWCICYQAPDELHKVSYLSEVAAARSV